MIQSIGTRSLRYNRKEITMWIVRMYFYIYIIYNSGIFNSAKLRSACRNGPTIVEARIRINICVLKGRMSSEFTQPRVFRIHLHNLVFFWTLSQSANDLRDGRMQTAGQTSNDPSKIDGTTSKKLVFSHQ